MTGNSAAVGNYSSGFYDVKKYEKAKRNMPDASDKYLKLVYAHIGVSISKNNIYIEDSYVRNII